MGRTRVHSREFKLTVVREVASGEQQPAPVCREHGLAESLLLRWRHEYEARGAAALTPPPASGIAALERRVADLERLGGQLALENAVLNKARQGVPSRSGTR